MDGIESSVWTAVEPTGLALALLLATIAFVVLTTVVMGLRIYIRLKTRRFGTDDWVMTAGYVSRVHTLHHSTTGLTDGYTARRRSTWGSRSW